MADKTRKIFRNKKSFHLCIEILNNNLRHKNKGWNNSGDPYFAMIDTPMFEKIGYLTLAGTRIVV